MEKEKNNLKEKKLCIIFGTKKRRRMQKRILRSFSSCADLEYNYLVIATEKEEAFFRKKWANRVKNSPQSLIFIRRSSTWEDVKNAYDQCREYCSITICTEFFHRLRIENMFRVLNMEAGKLIFKETDEPGNYFDEVLFSLESSLWEIEILNKISRLFRRP